MRNIRTIPQLLFRIFVRPLFPGGQWLARVTGIATRAKTVEGPHARQPYLIGTLDPDITKEDVERELARHGFFENRVAYPDPGQVLSMRRLDEALPDRQYHLRVFKDGEVRGHYEYTPEDHPAQHLDEALFEDRGEEFRRWLGPLLSSGK